MKFEINTTLQPVQNPVEIKHQNYLEYLSVCWANHYGAVISPDILWHIVLCELSMEISKNPETYRDLFTNSKEKQDISVFTDDPMILPLEKVIEVLKSKFKLPTDLFLPKFSTTGKMEEFVFGAAFLDLVSPYYSYSMFCCGIPYVEVIGTPGDYHMAAEILDELAISFSVSPSLSNWLTSVADTFQNIALRLTSLEYFLPEVTEDLSFSDFFSLEKCGSGSQVEVAGWIQNFFFFQPPVRYVKNFNSCVSKVEYKHLPTQIEYELTAGLNESFLVGDLLQPVFSAKIALKNIKNDGEVCQTTNTINNNKSEFLRATEEELNKAKEAYRFTTPGYSIVNNKRIMECDFK